MEELYWLLLITGHVLTDSGDGETVLVIASKQLKFPIIFFDHTIFLFDNMIGVSISLLQLSFYCIFAFSVYSGVHPI